MEGHNGGSPHHGNLQELGLKPPQLNAFRLGAQI